MIFFLAQLFTALVCLSAMTFAQDASLYTSAFFPSEKQHRRLSVRHIERGGIGYNKGYTTFEGFFAPYPDECAFMPFVDLRGHVFNDGQGAANAGIGFRKRAGSRVYGLNAYYDFRNTCKMHYNQVGFGAETLGQRWDFRINGYLPVGQKTTGPLHTSFAGFVGHNMLIKQNYQFAMKGFNAELGFPLGSTRCLNFFGAAGPYYFTESCGPKVWGGKARLLARVSDYLTLELSNSYDKMFRDRFQFQITLTLPFGRESKIKQTDDCHCRGASDVLASRMVQPVERQEIIVVGNKTQCSAALDPVTGNPFYFVFVDNTSHSQGTYESPYPTLALAQENSGIGDIIYVFPGNGTTQGMDAGITLQRNQKFWGSGVNHALQTSQGNITIPAQSSSAPKITNTVGDGITLSPINQVSGFDLIAPFNNGIIGTDVQSVEISECTINNSQQEDQIHLEYTSPKGTALLHNLTLTNGAVNGIFIDAPATALACTINNCFIQGTQVYTIDATCAHVANVNILNNTFQDNVNGTNFNFAGPSTLVASGNTFTGTTSVSSAPLLIAANTAPLTATLENNIIRDNECSAIRCVLNDTNSAQLNIARNTIVNNNSGSQGSLGAPLFINPNNSTLGNCTIHLVDNVFAGNHGGAALYCFNGSFNDFQVTATGNSITNNQTAGFTFATPCNTFVLNATNNTISGGTDNGIGTVDIVLTTAQITLANNQITGNTNSANGVILSHRGTDLNLTITGNTISDNEGSGTIMYSSSGIENVALNIANNTIANNQNLGSNATGGVDVEQFINLSGTFTNNTLSNNVGAGLFVESVLTSPSVCLTMNGNTSTTDYTLSSGAGTFNLAPCNVDAVNSGTINRVGTITSVQSCPGAELCS